MSEETTAEKEWKRERKTTDLGGGKYLLEWIDEDGNTVCSMELRISGDGVEKTIEQNYRLMRHQNKDLFVEPISEEEMMAMMNEEGSHV